MAAELQEAGNITPDHNRKGAYTLFKKRFIFALGCMTIRTQTELMIRRVQFIRRTHEAATQVACAGNTRGYHSEYGNSWFDNGENDDAYYIFFDHITTATTPHPILYLMKRTSYNSTTK